MNGAAMNEIGKQTIMDTAANTMGHEARLGILPLIKKKTAASTESSVPPSAIIG
jgi:hypothetical protein